MLSGVDVKLILILSLNSDGWADRPDVVEGVEEVAAGGMSIKLHSPQLPEFDPLFQNLTPFNNSRNPWFQEFWQEKFKCRIPGEHEDDRFVPECTGNTSD